METFSFKLLEVSLGRQGQKRVERVAIDVECSHTSRCCHTYLVSQEEPQTVDEVGLTSASSAKDYHSQWRRGIALHMLQYDVVCLQLLSLEVVRVSSGGESVLWSRLPLLCYERWHLLKVGVSLTRKRPVKILL